MSQHSRATLTFAHRASQLQSRAKPWTPRTSCSMRTSSKEREGLQNSDTWYYSDIRELPPPTRDLFEEYSKIPPEEVVPHIQEMRSRAFAIYPYPCIGQHRFLNLSLSRHPLYPEILARLRAHDPPQTFLDLGCCLAQDLRKLVADGAPSRHLYGLDLEPRFIDLGYDLFRDHGTLRSRFVVADLLAAEDTAPAAEEEGKPPPPGRKGHPAPAPDPPPRPPIPPKIPLAALTRKVDIVAANSIFHLYSLPQQVRLAKRVVALLAPVPGSLIVGRQVGSLVPGHYTSVDERTQRYSHDVASFKRFWEQVAAEVGDGVKFRVEARLDDEELGVDRNRGQSWSEPNIRRLVFGVWRE